MDVGTNTIRCLIASFSQNCLHPVQINRGIVRLGGGLGQNGNLSEKGQIAALELFKDFSEIISESGALRVWAVATSALRDAAETGKFLDAAHDSLGFPLNVISGEEEARLTAEGVCGGVGAITDGIVLDIGGGSTEIVRMVDGNVTWWKSLPLGVVYLTEKYVCSDPPIPTEISSVRTHIRDAIDLLGPCSGIIAGTAGTPTTLAAIDLSVDEYDSTLINGHVLSSQTIREIRDVMLSMTSAQRLDLPGMEKGREDLIVTGTIMLEEFLDHCGFSELLVSDWGLLEGIAIATARDGRGYDLKQ